MIPSGTTRDQYADALAAAIIMEEDLDFLQMHVPAAVAGYVARCREILIREHGFAPYPFDDESKQPRRILHPTLKLLPETTA